MNVLIPDALQSYTRGERNLSMEAADVDTLFAALDASYPGLRFRVINELGELRPHIKVFVDQELVRDLSHSLENAGEVMIVQALSGG